MPPLRPIETRNLDYKALIRLVSTPSVESSIVYKGRRERARFFILPSPILPKRNKRQEHEEDVIPNQEPQAGMHHALLPGSGNPITSTHLASRSLNESA